MGVAPHKIAVSKGNYYSRSSYFDLENLKNQHEVFEMREEEEEESQLNISNKKSHVASPFKNQVMLNLARPDYQDFL